MSRALHGDDERREAGILHAVRLPEDVLRLIFDHVHESSFMWYHHIRAAACYKDLLSCTLVCRDWRSPASYALYRWICVPRRRRFKHRLDAFSALLRTLGSFAASVSRVLAGTYVLELDVQGPEPRVRASKNSSFFDRHKDTERDAEYPTFRLLAEVLRHLPRLRKLSLFIHPSHYFILPAVFRSQLTGLPLTHLRVCYTGSGLHLPPGTLIHDCLTVWPSIAHLDILSPTSGVLVAINEPWTPVPGVSLKEIRMPRGALDCANNIMSAFPGGNTALRTTFVTISLKDLSRLRRSSQALLPHTLHTLGLSFAPNMGPNFARAICSELSTTLRPMTALHTLIIGECDSCIDQLLARIPTWVRELGVIYACDDQPKCAPPQWIVALLQLLEAPQRVVIYVAWPLTQPHNEEFDDPNAAAYSCEDAQRDARAFYHPAEQFCSARGIQFDMRPCADLDVLKYDN